MNNNNIDIEKLKNYINELDEQITPLTKKSNAKLNTVSTIQEDAKEVTMPNETTKKKITRTVTDKKKEQLAKAREIKNANHQVRTKQKKLEYAKMLLENEVSKPETTKPSSKPKPTKVIEVESDSEPEIIFVKKPKSKSKSKKIIIQDDETSSSGSEESDPLPVKQKSFGKSHRNKKSVIKVHDKPATNHSPFNYFCD